MIIISLSSLNIELKHLILESFDPLPDPFPIKRLIKPYLVQIVEPELAMHKVYLRHVHVNR